MGERLYISKPEFNQLIMQKKTKNWKCEHIEEQEFCNKNIHLPFME